MAKDLGSLKEALKRAQIKMSGTFTLTIKDIRQDSKNLLRSVVGRKMKKRVEEVKVEAVAATEEKKEEPAAPVEKKGSPMKDLK
jgi:hypothetical protein